MYFLFSIFSKFVFLMRLLVLTNFTTLPHATVKVTKKLRGDTDHNEHYKSKIIKCPGTSQFVHHQQLLSILSKQAGDN